MMLKYILPVLLFITVLPLSSQDIRQIDIKGLQDEIGRKSDSVYVVNFWATWCKPCTEEMPGLLKVEEEFRDDGMELILISLDLPSMKDTRLAKFISDHKIRSRVLLLDEPDGNKWIPMVDGSWSGSIPATLIYAPGKNYRTFHEGVLSYTELKTQIQSLTEQ